MCYRGVPLVLVSVESLIMAYSTPHIMVMHLFRLSTHYPSVYILYMVDRECPSSTILHLRLGGVHFLPKKFSFPDFLKFFFHLT